MASPCPRSSAPSPGIGTCEIEEGEDGTAELLGDLHRTQGLAIALGLGAAELAIDALLEGAALEVADDQHGLVVEEGHAAGHGVIIAKRAVAVDLTETGKQCGDEVHRIGALRVSR